MNTLEMIAKLRENPELKASCLLENKFVEHVFCHKGCIKWKSTLEPLTMTNYVLSINNWNTYTEKTQEVVISSNLEIDLDNGIGTIPEKYKVIGDLFVYSSEKMFGMIRPIGDKFAVPTDDKKVKIQFFHKAKGIVQTFSK